MCKRLHNFQMMRPAFLDALRSTGVLTFLILVSSSWLTAQDAPAAINIKVKADREEGAWQPVWNYFGYDEPNYIYSPNGKKLLGELAALSPSPVYVRTHNLFTSGDGSASLKWGSTNVYSEDTAGKPVHDWTIVHSIFDTYHELHMKPLVELGFMPQALSVKPEPYRHNFSQGSIYTGWAYPPKDYQRWADLVFHFVGYLRERYGEGETRSWLWEVWNEPDIGYWEGTREEFFKLYDYGVDAVLRALPGRAGRRSGYHGPSRRQLRRVSSAISGALRASAQLRDRQDRRTAGFCELSCQGSAENRKRACTDGNSQSTRGDPARIQDRCFIPRMAE
jgi:Glycosyl hydrolases family 39